jgi:putative sugar O-methyltransferase
MLKLKHVRHPLRTLDAVKTLLAARWSMKVLGPRGERRFSNDPRYNLRNVTDGFAARLDNDDDAQILDRICSAYIHATKAKSSIKQAYKPTGWWKYVQQASLAPVLRALASRDIPALRAMYRNFFRDPCSGGLIGVPYQMAKAYTGQDVDESYQRFFLSDALHRIDYWKTQTGNRFELRELAGPDIGNPFGVSLDGTFVRTGTEYQHYCAHKINELLPPGNSSVVEIGGGFGGMAYYLLRDRPETVYCDFDMPESIALTSYYLLKSLPHLKFLLFGEEELSESSFAKYNAVLLPAFELVKLPTKRIDLTFSSHTMSSLVHDARIEYMNQIIRATRKHFLYVGRGAESTAFQKLMRLKYPSLTLVERRPLEWHNQKFLSAGEEEWVYQIT